MKRFSSRFPVKSPCVLSFLLLTAPSIYPPRTATDGWSALSLIPPAIDAGLTLQNRSQTQVDASRSEITTGRRYGVSKVTAVALGVDLTALARRCIFSVSGGLNGCGRNSLSFKKKKENVGERGQRSIFTHHNPNSQNNMGGVLIHNQPIDVVQSVFK